MTRKPTDSKYPVKSGYTFLPDPPAGTTQVRGFGDSGETLEYEIKRGDTVTFFTDTGKIEARIDSHGKLGIRSDGGYIVIIPGASNLVYAEHRK